MNTQEMITIMMAHDNGKNIQMRASGSESGDWEPVHSPSWDWEKFDYRVHINNVKARFYEYRIDNEWKFCDVRMTSYEADDFLVEIEADEIVAISALGEQTVEDRRPVE